MLINVSIIIRREDIENCNQWYWILNYTIDFNIPNSTCINMVGNIIYMIYLRDYQGSELESFVIRIKWAWIGVFFSDTFFGYIRIVVDMIDLNFCIWCGIEYLGTFVMISITNMWLFDLILFPWNHTVELVHQSTYSYWSQIWMSGEA